MNYLKKLSLVASAVVFSLSLAAMSASAQPGRARYEGNNGKHKGWTQGKHYGWDRNQSDRYDRRDRRSDRRYSRIRQSSGLWSSGRITPQEYRRLSRQKNRISRSENRYYRDGSLSYKENRKLDKQYDKYKRSVYKARRR